MENNKVEKLKSELLKVTNKYELKNVIFGADANEGQFIGFHGLEKMQLKDIAQIVMNAARLYQSGREKLIQIFNDITK